MTLAQMNEYVANAGIVGSAFVMTGFWIYARKPEASALTKRIAWIAFPIAAATFAIMLLSGNDVIPAPWALIELLILAGAIFLIAAVYDARKGSWQNVLWQTSTVLSVVGSGAAYVHMRTHDTSLMWLSLAVSIVLLVCSTFIFTNTVLRKNALFK